MKLFFSPASPFVRKVMVVAHEAGIADKIELLPSAASPIARDETIAPHNPTGRVPTMILADGTALFDSRVICEYLDGQHDGEPLLPAAGPERLHALTLNALADGLLEPALLVRYETFMRPQALRWQEWIDGQWKKTMGSIATLERDWTGHLAVDVDLGTIATACALGWLDFRFPDAGWREGAPSLAAWYARFCERPSMQATEPSAPV